MSELAFAQHKASLFVVQATVISVGQETIAVKAGATVLRNVQVARPLLIEDIKPFDVVALTWRQDIPYATAILGHESGLRRDPREDTTPPKPPKNARIVQSQGGPYLSWDYNFKKQGLAYFEVDARLIGGPWGFDTYPVSEGTRTVHYSRFPGISLQVRVRAVDVRGNVSAWVNKDNDGNLLILLDNTVPATPTGMDHTPLSLTTIRLEWVQNAEPDISHYDLEVATSQGGAAVIAAAVGGNNYIITWSYALTAYWRLRAVDFAQNKSAWTAWQQAETIQPAPPELLNGNLEEGTGSPDHWTLNSAAPITTTWSTAQAYSPTHSVKIAVASGSGADQYYTALISDYIAVQQGIIYKLNCFTYTSAATSNVFRFTVFQYLDGSGTPAANPSRTFTLTQNTTWDYGRSSQNFMLLPGDDDVAYVRVAVEIHLLSTYTQSLYLDNFFMELFEIYQPGGGGGVMYHSDLLGITANQHHSQVHIITGTDHSVTGNQYQLVGLTAADTLGLLTPSNNPGAATAILSTDTSGFLTLVKLKTDTLADKSGGNLTIQPAGDLILNPGGNDVLPNTNYLTNLGSDPVKFLKLYVGELWTANLVAQNVISTVGGSIIVGPTTKLAANFGSTDTNMWVEHNQIARQDVCYLCARLNIEYIRHDALTITQVDAILNRFQVAGDWTAIFTNGVKFTIAESDTNNGEWTVSSSSYSSGYTWIVVDEDVALSSTYGYIYYTGAQATGPFRYLNVARNLDGSGANDWYAGDAVANTGYIGDGFIQIYSESGIISGSNTGPTIVGHYRYDASYEKIVPAWAIGNLDNLYGYSGVTWGTALGRYQTSQAWVSVDATNGFRVNLGTSGTVLGKWDTSGNILVGQQAPGKGNVYITSAGVLQMRLNTTVMIQLDATGDAIFGRTTGGNMMWDESDSALRFRGGETTQLMVNSSGQLVAGSDKVIFDVNGLKIVADGTAYLQWVVSGTKVGHILVDDLTMGGGYGYSTYLYSVGLNSTYKEGNVILQAKNYAQTKTALLYILADDTAPMIEFKVDGSSVFSATASAFHIQKAVTVYNGLTISSGNLAVGGSINQSTPLGARVTRTSGQTIGTGAFTSISFSSDSSGGCFDYDDCWTSGSPTRLTCKHAGEYAITANVRFAASAGGGVRRIQLLKNGATVIAYHGDYGSSASNPTVMNIHTVAKLAVNDYVEVQVFQDSGSDLSAQYASDYAPTLAMVRMT